MKHLPLPFIWHYLLVGMGGALILICLLLRFFVAQPQLSDYLIYLAFLIPCGLILGASSQALQHFMRQALRGNLRVIITGTFILAASSGLAFTMTWLILLPLCIECLLLIVIEKARYAL